MDENEVLTTEMEAEIDSSWDADEGPFESASETEDTAPQPEAETETEEKSAPNEPPAEPTEAPAQTPPADQPETYTLKNRDETKQVTREELLAMAQKGWDYDKVREERDQLRTYRNEADPALNYIKTLAQKSNMTVSDYLDHCRKQELMSTGINEATALAQINLEKQQAAINAQQARQQEEQQAAQRQQAEAERQKAERRAELSRFMAIFPDVKADSIPNEVWAAVQKGTPLTTAYAMHRNRALEAELAAERQNKAAKAQAPGSMNTAGEQTADPDFDGWDDDD